MPLYRNECGVEDFQAGLSQAHRKAVKGETPRGGGMRIVCQLRCRTRPKLCFQHS